MRPPAKPPAQPPASHPSAPTTPARLLHVRCLRPGCGREALLNDHVFGDGPRPAEGLSRRFVCACGRRAAHLRYVSRRPRPDNPCGWL
ncbi:hypothetical protein GGQ87_000383 [Brevundimonas alba]|uniref:Uncharacterized protein n=1 Tax=Brevundimonas alba TaxID=74314 RepID=A0A7X5YHM3_9CAUL|nr:hypothetical protein [Brevundimonas alba]NJC40125.1 hypothetical protein [Brevundimonas alba]